MARVWLTSGAALLALAFSSAARAQECTSDDDCADGFECDLGPVAMQDCARPDPSAPDAGSCDSAPSPRRGECEARKMTCDTDADCVKGLTCLHRGGDVACPASPASPDGGVSETPDCGTPEPDPAECVLVVVDCTKDSECDDGLQCAPIAKTTTCDEWGSPGGCMPGQECTPPEGMKNCTDTVHSFCFPPRVDCTRDADCDDGARCIELPDDAKKSPPPGWEGASALCFPEAFALVLEKRVDTEGGASEVSEGDRANSVGGSDAKSGGHAVSDEAQKSNDKAGPTQDGGTHMIEGDDVADGCTVSAVGTAGGAAWLPLGIAALLLHRRRRAVR